MLLVVASCSLTRKAWLLGIQMSLLCVTNLAPVGVIVTGEIVALMPCSASANIQSCV